MCIPRRFWFTVVMAAVAVLASSADAVAMLRVGQISTIEGETRVRLEGTGLVVGLKATGDGPNPVTLRAFRKYLENNGLPIDKPDELIKHSTSVALVSVSAEVPITGIRAGQMIDCQVSVLFNCKSLANGELIQTPLTGELTADDGVIAFASGRRILVEDQLHPTVGIVRQGAQIKRDIKINRTRKNQLRLLINPERASSEMAQEMVRAINEKFSVDAGGVDIASAVSDTEISVNIPKQYDNSTQFISLLKQVSLKDPSRPTVTVNEKSGTIVITDDVELRPTVFSHKNLAVNVGGEPFVSLPEPGKGGSPQRLADLLEALNNLKVPPQDKIAVLRALHQNGSLQAEFIEK